MWLAEVFASWKVGESLILSRPRQWLLFDGQVSLRASLVKADELLHYWPDFFIYLSLPPLFFYERMNFCEKQGVFILVCVCDDKYYFLMCDPWLVVRNILVTLRCSLAVTMTEFRCSKKWIFQPERLYLPPNKLNWSRKSYS